MFSSLAVPLATACPVATYIKVVFMPHETAGKTGAMTGGQVNDVSQS